VTFTWIGGAVIAWITFAFFSPLRLAQSLMFFSVFSASAIAIHTASAFNFQPQHLISVTLILSLLVRRPTAVLRVFTKPNWPLAWFFLFLLAAILSAFVNGLSTVIAAQIFHLMHGMIVATGIAVVASNKASIGKLAKAMIYGVTFSCVWGIAEALATYGGIEFPREIFNTSISPWAQGGGNTIQDGSILRVASVSTEPSFWVRSIICSLTLVLLSRDIWFSTAQKSVIVILFFLGVAVSTSSLGLIFLPLVWLLNIRRETIFYIFMIFVSFLVFCILVRDWIYPFIDELVLSKFTTAGSGLQRLISVFDGYYAFIERPILGYGLGSFTSHDLIFKILGSNGLIGGLVFFLFVLSIFFARWSCNNIESKAALSTFLMLLAMDTISGFSYTYPIFWCLLGLSVGSIWSESKSKPRLHFLLNPRVH
jgi:hypothetical protein